MLIRGRDGHWKDKAQKVTGVHVWRPRRSCRGELVLTTGRDRWSILSWIRWSMLLRLWPIPASTRGWKNAVRTECT